MTREVIRNLSKRYKLPEDFVERYIADSRRNGGASRALNKELMALLPNAIYASKFAEEVDDV